MRNSPVASPLLYARTGGFLYLVIIITGLFAEIFIRSRLIVPGDAAATAGNIVNSEFLWRLGFSAQIIMLAADVGVSLILYVLLKPVNKNIALLAAFFRLVSISVMGFNSLNHFAVTFLFADSGYLKAFQPDQINAAAYFLLRSHAHGYNISLVFFGIHCFFLGYLVTKASYFPGIIGILLIICSFCYVINSFAWFLFPDAASVLFPLIIIPCFIAELLFCIWLIVKGLNLTEWERKMKLNGN